MMAHSRYLAALTTFVVATALAGAEPGLGGGWTRKADLGEGRGHHTLTLLSGGRILAVGGTPLRPLDRTAEIYDVAADSWSFAAPTRFQHAQHEAVVLLDGRVLVMGGTISPRSAEIFDAASNVWTALPDMRANRYGHTATRLEDGKVLVAGGWDNEVGRSIRSAELFDPATSSWASTQSLGMRRAFHASVLMEDGRVLVTGGESGTGARKSTEIFDAAAGRFVRGPDMNDARARHVITTIPRGGRMLPVVVGGCCVGETGTAHASSELLQSPTPRAGWQRIGELSSARMELGIATLADGRVVVAGGENQELFSKATDVLDPATLTWRSVGGIPDRAAELRLVALPDGRVLVAGGSMSDEVAHPTAAVAIIEP